MHYTDCQLARVPPASCSVLLQPSGGCCDATSPEAKIFDTLVRLQKRLDDRLINIQGLDASMDVPYIHTC